MDPSQIVRAALTLTRSHGLTGWTLRALTARLDTSPSVVFHHIGDRAALSEAVVSELATRYHSPSPDLPWDDWVRAAARSLRRDLAPWPGVAGWLLENGPIFPHVMHVLDDGMMVLERDGFGTEAPAVYAMLYSTLIGFIAQSETRRGVPSKPGRVHHAVDARLRSTRGSDQHAPTPSGTGADRMLATLAPFLASRSSAEVARETAYAYLLDRLLDGLEMRRRAISAAAGPTL